jgi:hypothetical protein
LKVPQTAYGFKAIVCISFGAKEKINGIAFFSSTDVTCILSEPIDSCQENMMQL